MAISSTSVICISKFTIFSAEKKVRRARKKDITPYFWGDLGLKDAASGEPRGNYY